MLLTSGRLKKDSSFSRKLSQIMAVTLMDGLVFYVVALRIYRRTLSHPRESMGLVKSLLLLYSQVCCEYDTKDTLYLYAPAASVLVHSTL